MTTCNVSYDENFADEANNKFAAVRVKLRDTEHIFEAQDDYPRWFGLHNGVEIWDSELSKLRTWQLTPDYFQPYVFFMNEKMFVWNTTLPGNLINTPHDFEIDYKDMNNLEIKVRE